MYYPYLRGKQFELIALRDFADYYENQCFVMPVIEPVRQSFGSMKLALQKMRMKSLKFALILNPQVGEIINQTETVESELSSELQDRTSWIPAFIVINKNYDHIINHIQSAGYDHVMLICKDGFDREDEGFERLINASFVEQVMIDSSLNSLRRKLSSLGKSVIKLDDYFKPMERNSDYLHSPEGLFSDDFKFYGEEGFSGISDYTVLPSTFIEGGRLPYAVAIHMTYKKNEEQIFIRHFVSDTNDDNSNIQGKFGEAAEKATAFFVEHQISNQAIEELKNYYNTGNYPGLGMIKKISIKNHIELMNSVLSALSE